MIRQFCWTEPNFWWKGQNTSIHIFCWNISSLKIIHFYKEQNQTWYLSPASQKEIIMIIVIIIILSLAEQKEVPDERDDSEKIMEIMQVLRW